MNITGPVLRIHLGFNADSDPDLAPTFLVSADSDPDLAPTFLVSADPDPVQGFQ